MYSLFIGRYQPLHEGHCDLFRQVLNEGKKVCVAIRDTPRDEHNPYTVRERIAMVWGAFPSQCASGQMRVTWLPDIAEVCYGRKVGWGIREIRLDEATEAISATKIREAANG